MANDLNRIVPLSTGGTRPPVYCVHAVSGSAYAYTGLVRLLGVDQPVYGFEAPGFDNDRTPVRSLAALSAEYTATLREFQPEGEYQLLGWSMGGVLVFDMACRLAASGAKIRNLILVDAGLCEVAPLPPEREILRRYILDMMGMSGGSAPHVDAIVDGWPEAVEPSVAFEVVETAGILPAEIDADLLTDQYAVFRAHLEAFYAFEVTYTYSGPAVHIMASESDPEELRWGRVATDLKEYKIPGTHHSIWTGDSLVMLSQIVRQSLSS